jgi:hypothetical protein
MSHSILIIVTVAAVESGVAVLVAALILQLARVIERRDAPAPKAPQEPWWWPSFEREFCAYVESLRR